MSRIQEKISTDFKECPTYYSVNFDAIKMGSGEGRLPYSSAILSRGKHGGDRLDG